MKFFLHLISLLLLTSLPTNSYGAQEIHDFTLDNGLRVVVIPNPKVAAVSQSLWYGVGAMDEEIGKSGLAHFLEHLLFKETNHLQDGEFSKLVAYYGGHDNAFTSQNVTTYYQVIDSAHTELIMMMEANRMKNLMLNDKVVIKERNIVLEERNMRTDNVPRNVMAEKMRAALFEGHPYGVPTIGWRKEIEQLALPETMKFYKKYYNPNNAILILTGDIDEPTARKLAIKYYGNIPSGDIVKRQALPAPKLEKAIVILHEDEKVQQSEWMRFYLAPSAQTEQKEHSLPLVILAHILGGSQTSQLYRSLVEDQKLATHISSYYQDLKRSYSSFSLIAYPSKDVSFDVLEEAIEAALQRVIKNGVTDDELRRAKNNLKAYTIYSRDSLKELAFIYGYVLSAGLDRGYIDNWTKNVEAVTSAQIMEAAKFVFKENKSVTGMLVNPGNKDDK